MINIAPERARRLFAAFELIEAGAKINRAGRLELFKRIGNTRQL